MNECSAGAGAAQATTGGGGGGALYTACTATGAGAAGGAWKKLAEVAESSRLRQSRVSWGRDRDK